MAYYTTKNKYRIVEIQQDNPGRRQPVLTATERNGTEQLPDDVIYSDALTVGAVGYIINNQPEPETLLTPIGDNSLYSWEPLGSDVIFERFEKKERFMYAGGRYFRVAENLDSVDNKTDLIDANALKTAFDNVDVVKILNDKAKDEVTIGTFSEDNDTGTSVGLNSRRGNIFAHTGDGLEITRVDINPREFASESYGGGRFRGNRGLIATSSRPDVTLETHWYSGRDRDTPISTRYRGTENAIEIAVADNNEATRATSIAKISADLNQDNKKPHIQIAATNDAHQSVIDVTEDAITLNIGENKLKLNNTGLTYNDKILNTYIPGNLTFYSQDEESYCQVTPEGVWCYFNQPVNGQGSISLSNRPYSGDKQISGDYSDIFRDKHCDAIAIDTATHLIYSAIIECILTPTEAAYDNISLQYTIDVSSELQNHQFVLKATSPCIAAPSQEEKM